MFDNRDSIDFKSGDVRKLFSSIFFPTLLGMVFNMAFILTDGIFVGHGVGANGLASVNLVCPIMMLINGLGMMFGSGASVVAAIHLSKNNVKAARLCTTQVFIAATLTSLAMGVVCYLFPQPILHLLGAKGVLYEGTYNYYIWFIPTCLLMMIESVGLFMIRLDGSPRYAMFSNVIPAIVNILLDYIFIFPCKLGLIGASLATDLGGLVGTLMVMYYMLFRSKTLRFARLKHTLTSLRLSLRNIGYIVRMGASALIGEIAVGVMAMTGNLMFLRYTGADGVAAYSVICYLFPLVYMIYNAVAQSAQPILSYNHGLKEQGRVNKRKTLRLSLMVSIFVGVAMTLLFVFAAPSLVSVFLDSHNIPYALASHGLPYYATGFIFLGINISIIGYLQSTEHAPAAIVYTLLRGIILMVAAFVAMPHLIGQNGLWLAVPTAEAATMLIMITTEGLKRAKKAEVAS